MPSFVLLLKTTAKFESGAQLDDDVLALNQFTAELKKAGALKYGGVLRPSSHGLRLLIDGSSVRGPFAEVDELISAFWHINASSRDEAVEWARRLPAAGGETLEVDVRGVHGMEDFGDKVSEATVKQEAEQRAVADAALGAGDGPPKPRFLVIVKADAASEGGALPPPSYIDAMTRFNQELVDKKMMLAGEGLHPMATGVRLRVSSDSIQMSEGPFPLAAHTVAGFWVLQGESLEDVESWMKRMPKPEETVPAAKATGGGLEIRPLVALER